MVARRAQKTVASPVNRAKVVVYPESDGKPLAETQFHGAELVRAHEILEDYFAERDDVYVWGNMLLYYEAGNPRAVVSPDVFVVNGAPKLPMRRTWKVWEEGKPPSFALEVTSSSTRRVDERHKWDLYARLGVAEYVLYDPTAEYLDPPVRGCRLDQGHYADMPRDADGRMISDQLGLKLTLVDGLLEFFEPRTGARLLDRVEGRLQAEIETQHEARLRARAEARAEMEAARAEMEAARADAEAEARRARETRVAELERRLAEQAPPGN